MENEMKINSPLEKKLIDSISSYLSTRMGCEINFHQSSSSQKRHFVLESSPIKAKDTNAGLFRFIIAEFQIYVDLYQNEKDADMFYAAVSFHYEHINNSGSNGHPTNIRLKGTFSGTWLREVEN